MTRGGRWLDHVESTLSGLMLAVGLGIVMLEIVGRSVFGTSFIWSEEVSRYLLIWMTYFGVAAAVRQESHIRVLILLGRLPAPARRLADSLICLVCIALAAFVAWYGVRLVEDSRSFSLMSADSNLPIPIWVFQSIVPIGFTLVMIRFAQRLARLWRGVVATDSNGAS